MSVITVLIAPSNALSYYTIGQSAQKITQHSGIYMIDFTFGFNNRDVYIPIATQRGLSYPDTSSEDTVGYSFTSGTTTNRKRPI